MHIDNNLLMRCCILHILDHIAGIDQDVRLRCINRLDMFRHILLYLLLDSRLSLMHLQLHLNMMNIRYLMVQYKQNNMNGKQCIYDLNGLNYRTKYHQDMLFHIQHYTNTLLLYYLYNHRSNNQLMIGHMSNNLNYIINKYRKY